MKFLGKNWEAILSAAGFVITLVTFLQVVRLKRSQQIYDELVGTDSLTNLLSRISSFFTSNFMQTTAEVSSLQQEIQRSIGKIEGVKTALFKKKKNASPENLPQYIPEGYYSDRFLAERIGETKLTLRVFAKRNQRISNMDHLQSIRRLLEKSKNCTVELMAISEDTNDEILLEINKTIPIGASSLVKLKEEIIENRQKIIAFKDTLQQEQKDRFYYYDYLGSPPFHCIQVDDLLYFGLVNYHKSPKEYTVVENRSCVKFDIKSIDFAKRIKVQLESFIEECKTNGRVS